jgi:hypothetical protein
LFTHKSTTLPMFNTSSATSGDLRRIGVNKWIEGGSGETPLGLRKWLVGEDRKEGDGLLSCSGSCHRLMRVLDGVIAVKEGSHHGCLTAAASF